MPDRAVPPLQEYWRLLARWNERINLTALPLRDFHNESIDRLLIEPLAAAELVPDERVRWFDLGSGGGSPAIPLKILRPRLCLTMVEARARKAAFLREAVRTLALVEATVEARRFEDLSAAGFAATAGLVTLRAVRFDEAAAEACRMLLEPGGRVLLFAATAEAAMHGLRVERTVQLANGTFTVQLLVRSI